MLHVDKLFIRVLSGKQGKLTNIKATLENHQSALSIASTADGSVVLRIVKQPEAQHRARYLTEGSRGSVKDRCGSGFPTVTIEGYSKPTKLHVFVGSESGKALPHMFYQICRVAGKGPDTCIEQRSNGTNYIELSSEQRCGNVYVCDCIGILKQRFSDVEGNFPNDSAWKDAKRKSTHCRLVFKTTVENESGNLETLQVVSDLINCTQLPGTPEIMKTNTRTSPMTGGGELWIIGKNFLKDTKVYFLYVKPGKMEPTWSKMVAPIKDFFHPNHLIVKIPAFYMALYHEIQIQVLVRSSGKNSEPVSFTYTPCQDRDMSCSLSPVSPVCPPSDKISVIRSVRSVQPATSKLTILQPLDTNDNKRARVDWSQSRQSRPRHGHHSVSPWRTNIPVSRRSSSGENSSEESQSQSNMKIISPRTEPSGPFNSEDLSSSLTMDFTDFFKSKRDQLQTQAVEIVAECSPEVNDPLSNLPESLNSKSELEFENAKSQSCVSIEEAPEDKATIAISLPTSILRDQVQMKNIMETLNTTFGKGSPETTSPQPSSRKRAFESFDEPEELPCSNTLITATKMSNIQQSINLKTLESDPSLQESAEDNLNWETEELKTLEDKKWSEEINDILGSVIEDPMNFV